MGIDSHERISEDAVAQMLEESVQTCYRKGGEAVSILDKISKEAVKDKLHALEFPTEDEEAPAQKKLLITCLSRLTRITRPCSLTRKRET